MAEISARAVMDLRERTGAGMMDCKAALKEADGSFDEAVKVLRIKMGNKLTNRGERAAAEGIIAVVVLDDQDGAIIELNSETDFVARSDDFKALARELAEQVARTKGHSVETVLTQESVAQPGTTVQDRLNDVFTKLRENIIFKRFEFISTDENGSLAGYVHVPAGDKLGVLIEIEAGSPEAAKSDAVKALGRELAMQVAASNPRYLSREEVSADALAQEQDIARTTAQNEGKPAAALDKIVEGRVRKFYEETVLLEQPWLREPKKTVAQVIKEAGAGVTLKRFVRYEVGQVVGVETSGIIKEDVE